LTLHPNTAGLIVEPTYGLIRDTLLPKIDTILHQRKIKFAFHGTPPILTIEAYPNCPILFRSGEEPKNIVGFEVSWAWCDEVSLLSLLCWQQVRRRVRLRDGNPVNQQFATGTPDISSWCDQAWGLEELYGRPIPRGYAIYHGSTRNNIFNADGYVDETLRTAAQGMEGAVIEGHFVRSSAGLVFDTFDEKKNCGTVEYAKYGTLRLSFDFGKSPCSHCLVVQDDPATGMFYVLDEVWEDGKPLEWLCDEVVRRWRNHGGPVVIYGDAAGITQAQQQKSHYDIIEERLKPTFRDIEMDVPLKCPSVIDATNVIRSMLCNASGERRLIIAPHCKRFIGDLKGMQYAAVVAQLQGKVYTGPAAKFDTSDSTKGHLAACARYVFDKIGPHRNGWVEPENYTTVTEEEAWATQLLSNG
jgi:hypothetical protein